MAYGTGPECKSKRTNALVRSRAICHQPYALLQNEIRFTRHVPRAGFVTYSRREQPFACRLRDAYGTVCCLLNEGAA